MAAAALAYKCMEVACMRVVYCKHSSINRDRHELQATLQIAPKGTTRNLQLKYIEACSSMFRCILILHFFSFP